MHVMDSSGGSSDNAGRRTLWGLGRLEACDLRTCQTMLVLIWRVRLHDVGGVGALDDAGYVIKRPSMIDKTAEPLHKYASKR